MKNKLIFILVAIILFGSIRGAYSVGIAYSDFLCPHRPLIMYAGEEREVGMRLQNDGVADQKVRIKVAEDGGGILSFDEGDYLVKAKTYDKEVKFKVKILEGTPIGTKYALGLSVQDVAMEDQGGISLNSGMGVPICVQIGEYVPSLSPETGISTTTYIIIGIAVLVALILIVWFILKKKKI